MVLALLTACHVPCARVLSSPLQSKAQNAHLLLQAVLTIIDNWQVPDNKGAVRNLHSNSESVLV